MRHTKVSIAAILLATFVVVCISSVHAAETAASAMTENIARSCYSTAETRHDITTSATCWRAGYTQERLLGRWWQGTCDAGYITINEYQTADNQQRVYRDAALGTPAGFVLETVFGCLLPADSNVENTIPVFEMYKASISDYAYVSDPEERIAFIQNGYTEVGVLGRAKQLNRFVKLKQCVQAASNIHNWVYEDEACPSGYVSELVLDGYLKSNCDGETDTDLIKLYKYYSGTGSHRFLGTATTAPAGYNITPLGCFFKPTATAPNKIPVYSYSYLQGADKDSRYASTSTTPTAPWVNDNTIIGYTFDQQLLQLKTCKEASGRDFFTTKDNCPSGTTFDHITSMIWSYPCFGQSQYPVTVRVNGAVRRATTELGPNIGAQFIREYIVGCVVSGTANGVNEYPNTHPLVEYLFANGDTFLANNNDIYVPGAMTFPTESPSTGANYLGVIPVRYTASINACYESSNTRHYFTTNPTCPEGSTYIYSTGLAYRPPCLAGEIVLNSYILGTTSRRLGTTAPAGYTFESIVACLKSGTSTPVQHELYKESTTDYKYASYELYRRIEGLDGYVLNSQPNFYPADRKFASFRSCWTANISLRRYFYSPCASGWVPEDYRFQAWNSWNTEPNLLRLYEFYGNTSYTDMHYGTTLPAPSGFTGSTHFAFIKSVQEPGTYPLYHFRKSGLPTGTDSFLRINNTGFIPPGYTQVGGALGYVFNAYPQTSVKSPMYDRDAYTTVTHCTSTTDTIYVMDDPCAQGYSGSYSFTSLPCAYGGVLGNEVEEYCQWFHPNDHYYIDKCSNPPAIQLGYTARGSVGCLATQPSPGLIAVWRRRVYSYPGSNGYTYYDDYPNWRSGEQKEEIGYALPRYPLE